MPLATRIPTRTRRNTRSRSARVAAPRQATPTGDARRGGGPEDQALYSCSCGYAFKADVTTSVGCPQCGTQQAW